MPDPLAVHMNPYALAYLAGHSDFSTTKRYVYPQVETVKEAIERARAWATAPQEEQAATATVQ